MATTGRLRPTSPAGLPVPESQPCRLTLLYQLYLVSQASRALMRLAMTGSGMSGEEYALFSYLYANGPRMLTQAARDLGMPLTTLATLLAEPVRQGSVERQPHPHDGRARLLSLTDAGRQRLEAAMPAFTHAYRAILVELEERGADVEALFATLDELRLAIERAAEGLGADRLAAQPAAEDAGHG